MTLDDKQVRIDEVQDGIFRISSFISEFGISLNQFPIKGEKSALIHTGPVGMFGGVEKRVREVINPKDLYYVVFCHFESDEWGGMSFLEYPNAKLVCSRPSSIGTVFRKLTPPFGTALDSKMIHPMHGSSLDSSVHKNFFDILRTQDFAYRNQLLFEEVPQ